MRKSNKKGFTLVELVVVIAIIGVLAAILIPTMMNYVKKSRMRTANSNAKLVFESINNMASDKVADGDAVTSITAAGVAVSTYKGSSNVLEAAVWDALKDNGENGAGYVALSYDPNSKNAANWVQWQTNNTATNQITGQWPNAPKNVEDAEKIKFGTPEGITTTTTNTTNNGGNNGGGNTGS